jgi:hypothetical protein
VVVVAAVGEEDEGEEEEEEQQQQRSALCHGVYYKNETNYQPAASSCSGASFSAWLVLIPSCQQAAKSARGGARGVAVLVRPTRRPSGSGGGSQQAAASS